MAIRNNRKETNVKEEKNEKAIEDRLGNKNRIEITYNPYIFEMKIIDCSLKVDKDTKINQKIIQKKGKAIHLWLREFIVAIKDTFNSKNFTIIFNGREEEFSDLEDEVIRLNNNEKYNIKLEKKNILKEEKNIISELEKYVKDLEKDSPKKLKEELKQKNIVAEFEQAKNKDTYISIVATMSSGKSTLINSILWEELLPSKNEACTAAICQIRDIDGQEKFKVKAEDENGRIIKNWTEASSEILEEINENGNNKNINIFMEGDIKGISSNEMKLVLIDTPGTNNSQNEAHKLTTYRYIKDNENNPLIMYVINATQHGTEDDDTLLREISEIIKENGKQAEERFIFLLNKIDNFDPEKESVESLIKNSISYLKDHGIENPIIFPVSAEFAKLLRLEKQNKRLTRNQKASLEKFKVSFLPDPEDNYEGIDTIKYCSLSEKEKKIMYEESKIDLEKAYFNYSGIVAIEKYITKYITKYSKMQKIKDSIIRLKGVIDSANNQINIAKNKNKDEIAQIKNGIIEIKRHLDMYGENKIEEVKNKIREVKSDKAQFNKSYAEINGLIEEITDNFSNSKTKPDEARKLIKNATKKFDTLLMRLQSNCEKDFISNAKISSEKCLKIIENYFKDVLGEVKLDIDLETTLEGIFDMEIPTIDDLLDEGSYIVEEYAGERFSHYESTSVWYKPWTWGDKEAIYESVYENREYVDLKKISSEFEKRARVLRDKVSGIEKNSEKKVEEIKNISIKQLEKVKKNINTKLMVLNNEITKSEHLSLKDKEYMKEIQMIENLKIKLDAILNITK